MQYLLPIFAFTLVVRIPRTMFGLSVPSLENWHEILQVAFELPNFCAGDNTF